MLLSSSVWKLCSQNVKYIHDGFVEALFYSRVQILRKKKRNTFTQIIH